MRSKVAQRILDATPEETKIFVTKYAEIVSRIHDILKEKGLTQRDLAEGMGKNPSELSRWLKGDHNLTLRSIAKLEAELGEEIISIPKRDAQAKDLPKQRLQDSIDNASAVSDAIWTPLQVSNSKSKVGATCIA